VLLHCLRQMKQKLHCHQEVVLLFATLLLLVIF